MAQDHNRLGQEAGGETEIPHEQEPKKYFKVRDVKEGLFGFGFIPPKAIEALVGERLKISGFDTVDGEPALVIIQAEDIALALGMDGTDPDYIPANWWAGYASAFKNYKGEIGGDKGQIRIHISSGEIQEGEEDPDLAEIG